MAHPLYISITTGDPDGIGLEISAKALTKLGPQKGVQFMLWRPHSTKSKHLSQLDAYFNRITLKTWPEALMMRTGHYRELIDIASVLPPAAWVENTATACKAGHVDAIATAPLSKTNIIKSGYPYLGHTEILKKVARKKGLYMGFLGQEFNVLLASGHLPISEVPSRLRADVIEGALRAANDLRQLLPKPKSSKPIALVGLNPHAGEEGLIGNEETKSFQKALQNVKKSKIAVDGPLVPDAAFTKENWRKYSVYVSAYHDQGLIPFKLVHGHRDGVHITMGLPFVRTSVDHGTAKNIFGKNKADPGSMIEAIRWAIKLAKLKRTNRR